MLSKSVAGALALASCVHGTYTALSAPSEDVCAVIRKTIQVTVTVTVDPAGHPYPVAGESAYAESEWKGKHGGAYDEYPPTVEASTSEKHGYGYWGFWKSSDPASSSSGADYGYHGQDHGYGAGKVSSTSSAYGHKGYGTDEDSYGGVSDPSASVSKSRGDGSSHGAGGSHGAESSRGAGGSHGAGPASDKPSHADPSKASASSDIDDHVETSKSSSGSFPSPHFHFTNSSAISTSSKTSSVSDHSSKGSSASSESSSSKSIASIESSSSSSIHHSSSSSSVSTSSFSLSLSSSSSSKVSSFSSSTSSSLPPPPCRLNEDTCSASAPCCEGLECNDSGRCQIPQGCVPIGDDCEITAECCDSPLAICNANGKCASGLTPCSDPGQGCLTASDCCQNTPLGSVCNAESLCEAICLDAGEETCTDDDECCGDNTCESGTCTAPCRLNEDTCSATEPCCEGLECNEDGRCQIPDSCLPIGENCLSTEQCCDSPLLTVCGIEGQCEPVTSCGDAGDVCENNADCCQNTPLGSICNADFLCEPVCLNAGEDTCTDDSDCCGENTCEDGTCTAPCVPSGLQNRVINGGFATGSIEPWIVSSSGDPRTSFFVTAGAAADNDIYSIGYTTNPEQLSGSAVFQIDVPIPDGTVVSCTAFGREFRSPAGSVVQSNFLMFIDDQQCGDVFTTSSFNFVQFGGQVTVQGDTHTVIVTTNSPADPRLVSIFIDRIEVIAISGPDVITCPT